MLIWFEESIPIEKNELIEVLRLLLPIEKREKFKHVAKLLSNYYDYKFKEVLEELYRYYYPFNPDTNTPIHLDEAEEDNSSKKLIEIFKQFLEQGQYQPINEQDIQDIIKTYNKKGIKVIFPSEKYKEFLVYYRGEKRVKEKRKFWKSLLIFKKNKEIIYYERLALLFYPFRKLVQKRKKYLKENDIISEFRDITLPPPIILKLFQDIRQDYLPILFPNVQIKISFFKIFILLIFSLSSLFLFITSNLFNFMTGTLIGIILFVFFIYFLKKYYEENKNYYGNLLSHFYYQNISNNSGVLSYLVERIREEVFKQHLLILYTFWTKDYWATQNINLNILNNYLYHFVLKYFGIKTRLNLENIFPELLMNEKKEYSIFPIGKSIYCERTYLFKDAPKHNTYLEIENTDIPIPQCGVLEIAPKTYKKETFIFKYSRNILYLKNPTHLNFSHPIGSAIRWLIDKPYKTTLIKDAQKGKDYLEIEKKDCNILPLKGLGKIKYDGKIFEFRYERRKEDNKLHLIAGLRYRHTFTEKEPVLVRFLAPSFTLEEEISKGATLIPLPKDIIFPFKGIIKIEDPTKTNSDYISFELKKKEYVEELYLKLNFPISSDYPSKTKISLVPPITLIKNTIKKYTSLIPIESPSYFSERGLLIISPNSEHEERIPFRGKILKLKLAEPLQFKHKRGILIKLLNTSLKTNLIKDVKQKQQYILVQNFGKEIKGKEIKEGKIIIEPGEYTQEIKNFKVVDYYFELAKPTNFPHYKGEEIHEAKLESPLKYEALQGSSIITIEDASYFPMSGTLEIHFNGNDAIKEVFPFTRIHKSNTLILKKEIEFPIKKGTEVYIDAVEVTTNTPLHYYDTQIEVDFSCVPNFPDEGRLKIEPGLQREEIITFKREKKKIYINKPLKYFYPKGTPINFNSYMIYELKEPIKANQDRIRLEIAELLPPRGRLYIKDKKQEEIIWYRKLPRRIILNEPIKYHYPKGTEIIIHNLKNVKLEESIEKNTQKIRLINAQELPKKGKIIIENFIKRKIVEFKREKDILYLKEPIDSGFLKLFASIRVPTLYLNSHLSPGMDYLEVSDHSFLPESGELYIIPKKKFSYKNKAIKIGFQYHPNILWLDKPLNKDYEIGTKIYSPEILAKGSSHLETDTLEETIAKLENIFKEIYINDKKDIKNDKEKDINKITHHYLKKIKIT